MSSTPDDTADTAPKDGKAKGILPGDGILPGSPGQTNPGSPGQVNPGVEGQITPGTEGQIMPGAGRSQASSSEEEDGDC